MQRKISEMKIYKLSSDRLDQKLLLRVIIVRNQGKRRNLRYNCYIDYAGVYANACFYARYTNKEFRNFAYRIAYFLHTYVYMLSRIYFAYFDIHRIRINNRRLIITIAVRAHDIAIVLPRECRTEWNESVNFKKPLRFVIIVTLSSFHLFIILACVNNRAPIRRFELDNREIERMTRKHGEKSAWRVRRNSYYISRF